MNKKMFIICVVLVLISSCKHYGSCKEDLKNSRQSLREQVKGALDTTKDGLKEGVGGPRNLGLGAAGQEIQSYEPNLEVQVDGVQEGQRVAGQQQAQEVQVAVEVGEQPVVQAQELAEAGVVPRVGDNIKKEIEDLKNKINSLDSKKTSLGIYRDYEGEVKKIREKLNGGNDENRGNSENRENELKKLEDSLKAKKGARKKDLEESKQKFEGFKNQIDGANGVTEAEKVRQQGKIGLQALQQAQVLGLNANISKNDGKDSNKLANQVIDAALKEIEEELVANNIKK
ncbi:hypothetical protein [Borreliella lusitaniae]|uniref:hypothetical protein n=1 Tax=Borreliella lusitaniae TaxID=100177 RepID=UPI003C761796